MPGRSHTGPLPPLTPEQARISDRLRTHVQRIAGDIGGRSVVERPEELMACAAYIEGELRSYGLAIERQTFTAEGIQVANIIGAKSAGDDIIVLGAHYDTCLGMPGANDNGSGVAATLVLAELIKSRRDKTIRFAFFVNEEPPYFQTEQMGSLIYAARCRRRKEPITAMLSLETIGYYSDDEDTQHYPFGVSLGFPTTANFIGFVSNVGSRALLKRTIKAFRSGVEFPSEGIAAPDLVPGIGWSDHWSFWQAGYPAVMVTDTAPYRYAHYHEPTDTPEKLDYDRMARVVTGLLTVTDVLAG